MIQKLAPVPVAEPHGGVGFELRERKHLNLHPRLFMRLPKACQCGVLAGVHDTRHGCPRAVVAAAHQQHTVVRVAADNSRSARKPQVVMTDFLPQGEDVFRGWHLMPLLLNSIVQRLLCRLEQGVGGPHPPGERP